MYTYQLKGSLKSTARQHIDVHLRACAGTSVNVLLFSVSGVSSLCLRIGLGLCQVCVGLAVSVCLFVCAPVFLSWRLAIKFGFVLFVRLLSLSASVLVSECAGALAASRLRDCVRRVGVSVCVCLCVCVRVCVCVCLCVYIYASTGTVELKPPTLSPSATQRHNSKWRLVRRRIGQGAFHQHSGNKVPHRRI